MIDNVIGRDLSAEIKRELGSCDFVVTDENVSVLYSDLTRGAYVIKAGENNKNERTLFSILEGMCGANLRRNSRVAAIGGGVVGDITGLAAALYMRGIQWVSIPTTLLSMADSGIGGKTAIDFRGFKNLVGAFHSPIKTIISAHFLNTLPEREWLCGYGEIIKTCLLDKDAYELFKAKNFVAEKSADGVYELIGECVRIKSNVVEQDPTEKGLRKILNVGHTVGHALESMDGYKLSHGEYVICGMAIETEMNKERVDKRFYDEIMPVLKKYARIPQASGLDVAAFAAPDKKNTTDGKISVMTVITAGKVEEIKLDKTEFARRCNDAIEALV